ncbi:hypothetical protein MKZ38_002798 [Zalerion maritima]|uniref:Uncharacterized protein n=1 Tax=Zalerion maritima TaxID=339359 RepID=A0AAD5WQK3_9PEZI|nr:hypothetical protein MKZ38_002798 [Zalerion maritima]
MGSKNLDGDYIPYEASRLYSAPPTPPRSSAVFEVHKIAVPEPSSGSELGQVPRVQLQLPSPSTTAPPALVQDEQYISLEEEGDVDVAATSHETRTKSNSIAASEIGDLPDCEELERLGPSSQGPTGPTGPTGHQTPIETLPNAPRLAFREAINQLEFLIDDANTIWRNEDDTPNEVPRPSLPSSCSGCRAVSQDSYEGRNGDTDITSDYDSHEKFSPGQPPEKPNPLRRDVKTLGTVDGLVHLAIHLLDSAAEARSLASQLSELSLDLNHAVNVWEQMSDEMGDMSLALVGPEPEKRLDRHDAMREAANIHQVWRSTTNILMSFAATRLSVPGMREFLKTAFVNVDKLDRERERKKTECPLTMLDSAGTNEYMFYNFSRALDDPEE